LEVVVLGSGAGGLAGRRAQSSLLFKEGGAAILVDAGQPLPKRLYEEGENPASIGAVVVTHAHADHVLGLVGLVYELVTLGKSEPLLVVAGESTARKVKALADTLFPERARYEIVTVPERSMSSVDLGPFFVELFPVEHSVPTLGARVFSKRLGKCVFYSSDTVYLEKLKELAECDVGFHEATLPISMEGAARAAGFHSSPRQALEVLERAKLKVLTHISEESFRDPFEYEGLYLVAFDGLKISV